SAAATASRLAWRRAFFTALKMPAVARRTATAAGCSGGNDSMSASTIRHVLSLSGSIAFTVEEYGLIHVRRSDVVPLAFLLRQSFLDLRARPRIPAATKGTGESVAISALLAPTSGLLRSPVTKSAPSLVSPTVAHRCSSRSSPRAQAAQAPEPRTTSRIPMVRMSSVSVPDPGEKIRLGARIIVAPTATRPAATIARIEVDAGALSRITARPYPGD